MAIIKTDAERRSRYTVVAFCIFLAVAAFYLLTEHRAHLLGWIPYLIFLLCPLMHLFMHRSHPHAGSDDPNDVSANGGPAPGPRHH